MLNPDFILNAKRLLKEEYEAFEAALNTPPPVSIRINTWKNCGRNSINQSGESGDLSGDNMVFERTRNILPSKIVWQQHDYKAIQRIPWCNAGYYLPERPVFTLDPLFHAGVYYVQEASSMFLEQAILTILAKTEITETPVMALDLCAAPGGKATHLLSLLPENSLLVCNEVIRNRCLILAENIAKWGRPNVIITQNDPHHFGRHLPHYFDVILADLPCSGEGLFRKDIAARKEWSMENVRMCAARQRRIIHDIWEALKPGGYLIYCTCTFNTEENEENIKRLTDELQAEIIPIPLTPEWNVSGATGCDLPVYRFFPHRILGEGFFLALIRKKSTCPPKTHPSRRIKTPFCKEIWDHCNTPPFKGAWGDFNIPPPKGSLDFFISPLFAGNWARFELSYKQAITYLQREALSLPTDAPKGHLIVTWQNTPLGFVKNIGTRANNLYPREWRIRKDLRCF